MPVTPGQKGVGQDMKRFKEGTLHSGSKTGPIVRNRKQAIAISMSEAGLSKNQSPKPNRNNTSMAKSSYKSGSTKDAIRGGGGRNLY